MTLTKSQSPAAAPSLWSRVLFVLMLSGPPKFRLRDPSASLNYAVDWVILLHLSVWMIAVCWVLYHWHGWSAGSTPQQARFSKLGLSILCLFALLSISVMFSEAPAFSAFKVFQLAVTFAFITLYARIFGIYDLLNILFYGCAILALADIVAAFVMPDLVFVVSEFGTMRFRGDLLAQTGEVSLIGTLLLLTIKSDLPKAKFVFWAVVLGAVLLFSLARTSYLGLFLVVVLAALRPPRIPVLRKLVILMLMTLPMAFGALVSALNSQRQAEDIWTLSDRVGLWSYIVDATVTRGPWLGLGYFAASRIYGPEYNPDLGTAHSAFVEVYAGGGLLSFGLFLCIWMLLARGILRLYLSRPDRVGFAVVALFCAAVCLNGMGGELQAEPAGFCFWSVVAVLPLLHIPPRSEPGLATQSLLGPATSTAGNITPVNSWPAIFRS